MFLGRFVLEKQPIIEVNFRTQFEIHDALNTSQGSDGTGQRLITSLPWK